MKKTFAIMLILLAYSSSFGWQFFNDSNSAFYSNQALLLERDTAGGIYVYTSGKFISKYDGQQWINISLSPDTVFYPEGIAIQADGSIWYGAPNSVNRVRNGALTRFDSSNSCLPGLSSGFIGIGAYPLGFDASGSVLLFMHTNIINGIIPYGILRFTETTCDSISLGQIKGRSFNIGSYCRDSSGAEWFTASCVSDVPDCGPSDGIYKSESGALSLVVQQSQWFSSSMLFCDRDSTMFFSSGAGLKALRHDSVMAFDSVLGRKLRPIHCMFRDSRGVLWIGTEGYDFWTENIGLIRIDGADTMIINQHNSPFRGYFAKDIVEDNHGNIWIATWQNGVVVINNEDVYTLGNKRQFYQRDGIKIHARQNTEMIYDMKGKRLDRTKQMRGVAMVNDKLVLKMKGLHEVNRRVGSR